MATTTPSPRAVTRAQRERLILAELEKNPGASYRDLAAAANCSTSQVRAIWKRLAERGQCVPRLPSAERVQLAGFAEGWDIAARLAGNPAV